MMFTTPTKKSQAGFGLVVIVLLLLVITVVGLVAYKVYKTSGDTAVTDGAANSQPQATTELNESDAPEITSAKDLDTAAATLDKIDADSGTDDTAELDGQLNGL